MNTVSQSNVVVYLNVLTHDDNAENIETLKKSLDNRISDIPENIMTSREVLVKPIHGNVYFENNGDNCGVVVDMSKYSDAITQTAPDIESVEHNGIDGMMNEIDDPTKLNVCPHCKAFFSTTQYLKTHMKRKCVRAENTNNTFACDYCSLSFKQRFQLQRHMMQHTGERPFKCETCPKTFLTKSHLKRHSVVHLPHDQLPHKCEHCDKVFAYPSNLVSHMQSHNGDKRFKCGICGRKFLHLNSLRSHTVNRHTVNGKFICVVCKECFDEAAVLILHMKTHNDEESVKCNRCNSFFTSLNDLETHVCTNFGGDPLICVICTLKFNSTNDYVNHSCMQVNMNRKCGCCSKELKSLWHLREHLITHTAEKPFQCEHCHQTFRRKRELHIHVTRHGNERPYTCIHCAQTFTSDNYLKQHMRKEHREKKFVCGICNHSFMHKCALNNHMSFHLRTGNKNYGKKHHRDDGLLVEELVQSRLTSEKEQSIVEAVETIETSSVDMTKIVMEENLDVDETIDLQEETLTSETNGNYSSPVNVNANDTTTRFVDNRFPTKVIQPRIELRNAEQDPSNITTIYQTNCNGALTIRCASCYQHFQSHSILLRHRKEFHNDGKPYQCDFCSRTFSVAANLSQHRSIHNIKRKYSCNKCGKSYKVTHKLREHLKLKHDIPTEDVTDLDLHLRYGLSISDVDMNLKSILMDDIMTPSKYITDGIMMENPVQNDFDENASLICNDADPLKMKNDCEELITDDDSEISKVASNIVYVETGETCMTDKLSKNNDVSFLMNITKLINDITESN